MVHARFTDLTYAECLALMRQLGIQIIVIVAKQ